MDPMMELVNALNALTAALQKFSSQTTNAYLDTFEEIYDPEKDEPQAAEAAEAPKEPPTPEPEKQAVTFVQLRSRLSEISRSGKTAEVKELIAKYGASKLSDIAESDYAAVLAEAEGL